MQDRQDMHPISVIWRGKTFIVEMNSHATLRDLGDELQNLTHVKVDTMRFIVPQSSNQSSKLFTPFSYEHECLSLKETSIIEAKAIRMMGVPEKEIDEILQAANANLRIAGFDEEEKRLRQRFSEKPHSSLRLPQGPYIFCDFRTLQLPGVELNPPPSEALKRMHMLAADPGIVAIMNKHHWRVGIMTEMAPIGYVGISPKCLLGFNKNCGEEISMRLRTDDLKGFRKYESIKKTLLHELAHMVFSEHDANFYALDKQLNQEAASLDWTRSRSHTLSGVRHSEDYEEDFHVEGNNFSHKLGGNMLDQLANARKTSVAAAYRRLENASFSSLETSHVHEEPDPDDSEFQRYEQPNCINSKRKEDMHINSSNKVQGNPYQEPDPDDHSDYHKTFEPDPDGYSDDQVLEYPDKTLDESTMLEAFNSSEEPDPDNLESFKHSAATESESEPETFKSNMDILGTTVLAEKNTDEPDPDDMEVRNLKHGNVARLTEDDSLVSRVPDGQSQLRNDYRDSASESQANGAVQAELYPQDNAVNPLEMSRMQIDEPDPDDEELQRIQDPVTVVCTRLKKAIDMLQAEVNPKQATIVVQTLFKIIRNVIEHPSQLKYRRLRKNNPIIQSNVANYKAAMEFLFLIGFCEDVVADEIGKAETYLVLKRNDPGLLWLAKSSLETLITC